MSTELMVRADQVHAELTTLRSSMTKGSLRMGRLLREVLEEKYYQEYGFGSFERWIVEGSGLEISPRSAKNAVAVVRRQEALGIPDTVIEEAGFTKASQILSLTSEEASDQDVVALLESAKSTKLTEIKDAVALLKGRETVTLHYSVSIDTRDNVIVPAFEQVRARLASGDVSDSRAFELICAEFLTAVPAPQVIDISSETF